MTEQAGVRGKLKDALFTMVAEQDRNIRLLTDDVKAFSQYAKSKVKNIQERRRQRQQLPGVTDLIYDINEGAGSEILSHFKHQWNDIHQEIVGTSEKMEETYEYLQKLYSSMSNAHHIITMSNEELNTLPEILKTVEETNSKISSIEELLRNVEDNMAECIKTGNQLDNERKKHSLRLQLQRHREEKERELQKYEANVLKEKELTLQLQEKLEQAAYKDRKEALEDMFKQQMMEYKEKGSVEKPILSEEAARERTLSEQSLEAVEIVDTVGDQQLMDFLRDTEVPKEDEKKKDIELMSDD